MKNLSLMSSELLLYEFFDLCEAIDRTIQMSAECAGPDFLLSEFEEREKYMKEFQRRGIDICSIMTEEN